MKKRIISALLALTMALSLMVPAGAQGTISNDEQENIAKALFSLGLFSGYDTSGANFGLRDIPTREQALIFQLRVLGEDGAAKAWTGASPYSDIPANSWALPYVGYATEKGYTKGSGGGKFGLGQAADALMMSTFLLRGLGYTDSGKKPDFTYENSVAFATGKKMAYGTDFAQPFTRGDAAEMLYRSLGSQQKNGTTLADALMEKGLFTKAQYTTAIDMAVYGKVGATAELIQKNYNLINYTGKEIVRLQFFANGVDLGQTPVDGSFLPLATQPATLGICTGQSYLVRAVCADGSVMVSKQTDLSAVPVENGKLYIKYIKDRLIVTGVEQTDPLELKLRRNAISLVTGNSYDLTYSFVPAVGKAHVTYESYDERIIKVKDGVVTALGAGKTSIAVRTSNGLESVCTVVVFEETNVVTDITFDQHRVTMTQGETIDVKAYVWPLGTSGKVNWNVPWHQAGIISVTDAGRMTGINPGLVSLEVQHGKDGVYGSCTIQVQGLPNTLMPTSITTDQPSVTVEEGKKQPLTVNRTPVSSNKYLKWSSSNEDVAMVTHTMAAEPQVVGIMPGVATITATTSNGLELTFDVTVGSSTNESISITLLNKTTIPIHRYGASVATDVDSTLRQQGSGFIEPNQSVSFEVVCNQVDGYIYNFNVFSYGADFRQSLSFWNENVDLSKYSSITFVLTDKGEGELTWTLQETPRPAVPEPTGPAAATGVTLDKVNFSMMPGASLQVSHTVAPASANQTVKWRSLNTKVATVDAKGVVTAVGVGHTYICAETDNYKLNFCGLTVNSQPDRVVATTFVNKTNQPIHLLSMGPQGQEFAPGNLIPNNLLPPGASFTHNFDITNTQYLFQALLTSYGTDYKSVVQFNQENINLSGAGTTATITWTQDASGNIVWTVT